MNLRPEQQKAVDQLDNGKILYGNVGSGKTITSLAYFFTKVCKGQILDTGGIALAVSPMRLVVITTAKKRDSLDWEEEASNFGISSDPPYRMIVDSWNNIAKYIPFEGAFFIFDEQRVIGRGKWVKSFLKITKKNKWILLSATPGDTYSDYIPVFIANDFYKSFTDFSERHIIYNRFSKYPKIDDYRGKATLEYYKNKLLVPMLVERENVEKLYINVETEYNKTLYNSIKELRGYYDGDEYHPIRSTAEFAHRLREVANSDDSKISKLRLIFMKHRKLIVFYRFDYELYKLIEFAESMNILYAQQNGHKHEEIPKGDEWLYFVQYASGAEAWNCIETDTIVFYCLDYSYKVMKQASGRIDRMNSPFPILYYYYLFSKSPFDKGIWRALQNKKTFNEDKFVQKFYEKNNY